MRPIDLLLGRSLLVFGLLVGVAAASIGQARAEQTDALAEAIQAGDLDRIRALLHEVDGPDVVLDRLDTTPLRLAAVRGEKAIVAALLEAGADVNRLDLRGVSTLSAAVRSCKADIETVDVLIDAGADIENRSGAGLTPLMAAIQENWQAMAEHLIRRGADVQVTNNYGDGVLNYAIYYRMPDVIAMALDREVNTGQLKLLYRNDIYYFPNFGEPRPHCPERSRE